MTQKDKMLQMVLNNEQLMKQYDYTSEQLNELDLQEALRSDNAIIVSVARIIRELDGSMDSSKQKEVYKKVFTHLNNNLFL
ncbi:MAG: hypothetical protein IK126_09640 [Bacteroidales bacterium]|nr:hypothetical protein [Bacteroidales bacterium]